VLQWERILIGFAFLF